MCIFADERGWYSVKPRKNQSGMKIAGNKISGVAELLKAATPVMAAVLMPLFLTAQPVMAVPTEPMRQVRELKGYRGLSADELAQCAWILCGREELGTRDARLALSGNLYSENLPACAPEAARSDFFVLHGDTLLWTGYNVGRRLGVLADEAVSLCVYPPQEDSVTPYRATGRLDVSTAVEESGVMEWHVIGRGYAITSPGDTIYNVVLTSQSCRPDSTGSETGGDGATPGRVTYRWYAPGRAVPVAIQFGDLLFADTSAAEDRVDGEYEVDGEKRQQYLIDTATVKHEDGRVTVTLAEKTDVHVYIMDAPGNIYASASGPGKEFTLSTAGLPHNRYIVSIVAEPGATYVRKIIFSL